MFTLYIITLYLFLSEVSAQNDPCMSHFFISNEKHISELTGIGQYIVINEDCMKDIPDYQKESIGHNFGMECWIYEGVSMIHKVSHSTSRCGECLELTGPSQSPFNCIIVGTFSVKQGCPYTKDDLSRMIIVKDGLFKLISTSTSESNYVFSQVTVKQADCNFHYPPFLYTLKKNETSVELQILNSAVVIEKIIIDDNDYLSLPNSHFIVPLQDNTVNIKLIAVDGRICNVNDVNLNLIGLYVAKEQFTHRKVNSCPFMPSTQVYINSTSREQSSFFKWIFNQVNMDYSIKRLNDTDQSIHFVAENARTTLGFGYPTVIKMYELFSLVIVEMEVEGNLPKYAFSTLGHGNQFGKSALDAVFVCNTNIPVEVLNIKKDETHYFIKVKLSIPKHCYGYLNVIALTFVTVPGTIFDVKNITLIPKKQNNVTECGVESFDCQYTECTDSNTINPLFSRGCFPRCGSCRNGLICSSGKCVKEISYNSRSSTISVLSYMIFTIVLLLI
ncbi:hypothetical protein EHI8A_006200 [Entamoeba histolytica HM-1:IMSS-B]|uniref:ShKT domain-containing protein n=6 Tax=Entamoeba histolytica TaxID=5759 RepID=C4LX10_ENTH1|nr:hypothetical protein EHI_127390 [Entamoeba histolytica HM-1:IMSS]EMD44742.1 Hypothetical protein EHI5A_016690 [Entamoeba histolytica KU27]EMH75652.1 hypothetical protein EHI8A_006200 [Entamoeba histolytica HM-1:IMSS-B]EMS12139.1 hypothetical protein KM1_018590 [Entamoeba histolytica HM-3:IMSS]ENY65210.1 hypothetical protein EHI7A_006980 [Entamoeba histolytica HM-1:IMSS-A]GAT93261.1 hypothetical protein CL6EHI_127390 [Entamoeba histolytica]|eukprot:XP_652310.2 hypothetical protein EHI_127390 [Entamoeba histolytica HM-1:IMSS]